MLTSLLALGAFATATASQPYVFAPAMFEPCPAGYSPLWTDGADHMDAMDECLNQAFPYLQTLPDDPSSMPWGGVFNPITSWGGVISNFQEPRGCSITWGSNTVKWNAANNGAPVAGGWLGADPGANNILICKSDTPPVPCPADLSAAACKDFTSTADFDIKNNANTPTNIDMTYSTIINGAYSYVGQGPWDELKSKTSFLNQAPGVVFTNQGSTATSVTCQPTGTGFPFACPTTNANMVGNAHTACGLAVTTMQAPIASLVSQLDANGDYELYFQRIDTNPITGAGIVLNWIAERACKIKIEVTFQCTGTECVEVTTIVCATFAGIDTSSFGRLSTECKIPSSFQVSSTAAGGNLGGVTVSHPSLAGGAWTDNTIGCNGQNGVGTPIVAGSRCFFDHTSTAAIATGTSLNGKIRYEAYVQGPAINGNQQWSQQAELLHEADYNLTVASALAKTFDMDVNVKFHSTRAGNGAVRTTVTDILNLQTDAATPSAVFGAVSAAGPFLARSKVEMGAIVNHQHAYLQVVAKVGAGSSKFQNLRLTKVVHTTPSATHTHDADTHGTLMSASAASGKCTVTSLPGSAVTGAAEEAGNGLVHWIKDNGAYWPLAYLHCMDFMNTGFNGGPAVVAGDTLVISLAWKLAKTSTTSGKAALLQEADPTGQNVEVSLTIQLGGGETTITTAGAGEGGSADNTVTYIIIAVCVIAAALILAVVVVAFMCLRNRSQEQLVAMSPQKATVAAVYDISQPKAKADAMDV